MKHLVVLDYTTAEVHFYTVTDEASERCEKTVEALGHKADSCSWMIADNIEINFHGKERKEDTGVG